MAASTLSTSGVLLDIVKGTERRFFRKGPSENRSFVSLSPRLQAIYDQLLLGEDVWDFCCDHGYLGIEALRSEKFENVFFVDQVPHIIQKLEAELFQNRNRKKAHFRATSAESLQEPVKGNAVIAGVGAFTAFKIVESLFKKDLLRVKRLIVSPQRDDEKLVLWMSQLSEDFKHRYFLKTKQQILERRRPLWVYVWEP